MNIKQKKTQKEILNVIENGYTVEKIIHKGYTEYETAKKTNPKICEKYLEPYFGKWHYIYRKGNMKISLIKIRSVLTKGWHWEIYAFEDERLFTNELRFNTKKEGEEHIKKIF